MNVIHTDVVNYNRILKKELITLTMMNLLLGKEMKVYILSFQHLLQKLLEFSLSLFLSQFYHVCFL